MQKYNGPTYVLSLSVLIFFFLDLHLETLLSYCLNFCLISNTSLHTYHLRIQGFHSLSCLPFIFHDKINCNYVFQCMFVVNSLNLSTKLYYYQFFDTPNYIITVRKRILPVKEIEMLDKAWSLVVQNDFFFFFFSQNVDMVWF